MVKRRLWVAPEVYAAREHLPGNVRQRMKRIFDGLVTQPRPSTSKELDISGLDVPTGIEIRRVRLEGWRVVYAINETEGWVWVLRIHRRPPYDYEDLKELVDSLG